MGLRYGSLRTLGGLPDPPVPVATEKVQWWRECGVQVPELPMSQDGTHVLITVRIRNLYTAKACRILRENKLISFKELVRQGKLYYRPSGSDTLYPIKEIALSTVDLFEVTYIKGQTLRKISVPAGRLVTP